MESTPIAPSPKIPKSQQEAQDSLVRYLQKTVDGLPPGTVLDTSDTIGGSNVGYDDNYTGPGPGLTEFSLFAKVIGPAGMKPTDLIAHAGELWRSWGITVIERDGFEKPNHSVTSQTDTTYKSRRHILPTIHRPSSQHRRASPATYVEMAYRFPR
ncbi:hypothetical protein [Mycobacterium intracellulare]|uniref:hypothetical protein n=1 Tax=Mycobacterium intracellulare TaxID=1767 RepID=UPI000AAF8174|nr:hypothetical protein [Mycobacterium intracellulare]